MDPLSQTVTPSQTPSSVTYFLDGPKGKRKIWMDNVREDLKAKNIDLTTIGEVTRNREVWRSLIRAS